MSAFITVGSIAILAAISPGPDFAIVTKNALSQTRVNAIFTALGVGASLLCHSLYCSLGLALIIIHSPVLFKLIRYLGAAYLIYLGVMSLIAKVESELPINVGSSFTVKTKWQCFSNGLFVNLLNVKAGLFMLSIFTLVVKPPLSLIIQMSYGLEIACVTAAWFCLLAAGLTTQFVRQRITKLQKIIVRVIGVLLILLGVVVVFH